MVLAADALFIALSDAVTLAAVIEFHIAAMEIHTWRQIQLVAGHKPCSSGLSIGVGSL